MPGLSQNRPPSALLFGATEQRRFAADESIVGQRSSVGLVVHIGCAALCAGRLQCTLLAGNGLEYARSSVVFADSCASVDAAVLYDSGNGLNQVQQFWGYSINIYNYYTMMYRPRIADGNTYIHIYYKKYYLLHNNNKTTEIINEPIVVCGSSYEMVNQTDE